MPTLRSLVWPLLLTTLAELPVFHISQVSSINRVLRNLSSESQKSGFISGPIPHLPGSGSVTSTAHHHSVYGSLFGSAPSVVLALLVVLRLVRAVAPGRRRGTTAP